MLAFVCEMLADEGGNVAAKALEWRYNHALMADLTEFGNARRVTNITTTGYPTR